MSSSDKFDGCNINHKWIYNKNIKLHAIEYPGAEPSLIIVPGITSPAPTWKFVVDSLEIKNRVIILDNRGRGYSDRPATGYSLNDYADDLKQWLDSLEIQQCIMLGHSMGARCVVKLENYSPGCAIGLLLIEPPLSGPGRSPYPFPLDFYLNQIRKVKNGATIEELRADSPGWTDQQLRDRLEWLGTCSEEAVRQTYNGFHQEDFYSLWMNIESPCLFVYGENSPVITDSDIKDLQIKNPRPQIRQINDAGHMIPWDNLYEFVDVTKSFIYEVSKPDSE